MGVAMSVKEARGGMWRFSYRVVLPVLLAVGITVATVAWFALWSTGKSDDRALQRQTHLVAHAIDEAKQALTSHQNYYANWDEAITAIKAQDVGWLDDNLGAELYDTGKYDRIYVLGPTLKPLYAMYAGGKTVAAAFEADRGVLTPMLAILKPTTTAIPSRYPASPTWPSSMVTPPLSASCPSSRPPVTWPRSRAAKAS